MNKICKFLKAFDQSQIQSQFQSQSYSLAFLLILFIIIGLGISANPALAQIRSNVLYCCEGIDGQRVCADKRAACWGKETFAIDHRGVVLETFPPPLTREQRLAISKQEKEEKAAIRAKELEEQRFTNLLGVYGTPESIDREIERQERESAATIVIAHSRLNTAKENVITCQNNISQNIKTADCNPELLEVYKKTVVDIEAEIVNRQQQTAETKKRLLATKAEILEYQRAQQTTENN